MPFLFLLSHFPIIQSEMSTDVCESSFSYGRRVVDCFVQVIVFHNKSKKSARKRDNESKRSDLGGRHWWNGRWVPALSHNCPALVVDLGWRGESHVNSSLFFGCKILFKVMKMRMMKGKLTLNIKMFPSCWKLWSQRVISAHLVISFHFAKYTLGIIMHSWTLPSSIINP